MELSGQALYVTQKTLSYVSQLREEIRSIWSESPVGTTASIGMGVAGGGIVLTRLIVGPEVMSPEVALAGGGSALMGFTFFNHFRRQLRTY